MRARRDRFVRAVFGLQRGMPERALRLGGDQARAGADHGAAFGGVQRVQHHQPAVVHPAVGIGEAAAIGGFECPPPRRCGPNRTAREAGRRWRRPRWSYRNRPARIIQAGRCSGECGSTNSSGQMMCGAMASRRSRSRSASGPGGIHNIPGSAARHAPAWCWRTRCARQGRAAQPAAPKARAPRRRGRCRRR